MLFDLNDKKSFTGAEQGMEIIKSSSPEAQFILVGTKGDFVKIVSKDDISKFCNEQSIAYVETSAFINSNVSSLFELAMHMAYMKKHNNSSLGIESTVDFNLESQLVNLRNKMPEQQKDISIKAFEQFISFKEAEDTNENSISHFVKSFFGNSADDEIRVAKKMLAHLNGTNVSFKYGELNLLKSGELGQHYSTVPQQFKLRQENDFKVDVLTVIKI